MLLYSTFLKSLLYDLHSSFENIQLVKGLGVLFEHKMMSLFYLNQFNLLNDSICLVNLIKPTPYL